MTTRMNVKELEQARRNILARRTAVLVEGGPHAQELASALFGDVRELEHAIQRRLGW